MGQAKRRGSYEQRKTEGAERRREVVLRQRADLLARWTALTDKQKESLHKIKALTAKTSPLAAAQIFVGDNLDEVLPLPEAA